MDVTGPQAYATPNPQGYGNVSSQFPGPQWMADPMANMAVQYGQNLADHGQQIVKQNVSNLNKSDCVCVLFFSSFTVV